MGRTFNRTAKLSKLDILEAILTTSQFYEDRADSVQEHDTIECIPTIQLAKVVSFNHPQPLTSKELKQLSKKRKKR